MLVWTATVEKDWIKLSALSPGYLQCTCEKTACVESDGIQDFSCSTVCACRIPLFIMLSTLSRGARFGLQAYRSSTHCLWSHAVVNCEGWSPAFSCWTNHRPPGKRCNLASALMVPSHMCKSSMHTDITVAGFCTFHWQQSGWSFTSWACWTQTPFSFF